MTFTFFDLVDAMRRKTQLRFSLQAQSFVDVVDSISIADHDGRVWILTTASGGGFAGNPVLMWFETNAGNMTLAKA